MVKKLFVLLIGLSLLIGSYATADIDGLILYFPFDEGSGDTAIDASGTGNNGVITGATWSNDGKIDKALEFDGSSFVEVPSSDSLEELVEEMTMAAWINPLLTGSDWQGIITKGNDAAEHFELLVNVNGHIHTAQMFTGGRGIADRPAPGSIVAGEWQHLAVTYSAADNEWILYINGSVQDNSSAGNSGDLVPDGNPLVVGDERPPNRLFQGLIDEVAVFNRAISADEVNEIMGGIGGVISVEPAGKIATTWADIKQK